MKQRILNYTSEYIGIVRKYQDIYSMSLKHKRKWVMQQDNDPKHTNSTQEWLKERKEYVLDWLRQSSIQ